MDRLISEQQVLKVLDNLKANFTCYDSVTLDEVASHVKAIPSAELKTGHWIADVDKWGDIVTTVNGYRCDKCNAFNSDKDNYCPNCGCRMVEEQESEDKE